MDVSRQPKIGDFGLSVILETVQQGHITTTLAGRASYQAPEQIEYEVLPDLQKSIILERTPEMDIFAFGCVCYMVRHSPINKTRHYLTIITEVDHRKGPQQRTECITNFLQDAGPELARTAFATFAVRLAQKPSSKHPFLGSYQRLLASRSTGKTHRTECSGLLQLRSVRRIPRWCSFLCACRRGL
jgi:serine/threonine protein kinase